MVKKKDNVFAAIHLGSEKISLQIIEYRALNSIKVLDTAERRVRIAEETFKTGKVSAAMVKEICSLLNNYKRMMKEYGVKKYRLIGTTAMREARNRSFMIDQILMATGLEVEVIDMPLEIYYKYISLARTLKQNGIGADGSSTLFADISSGGLGITLVENTNIKYQQSIHIGILRVKESFDKNQRAASSFNTALTEYISSIVSPVHRSLQQYAIKRLVLSGTNTNLLLHMLDGKSKPSEINIIPTSRFEALAKRVLNMRLAKIMQEFGLSEAEAEIVLPTIVFYQQLTGLTAIPELVFPPDAFIDSISLLHVAEEKQSPWLEELDEELIEFVYNIARYYKYDSGHARQVLKFSELIFDRLHNVHGLTARDRLILRVASILHDIGKYINLRQHYFYSYRLILSTDIFGLSDAEKRLAAYISYHHSKDIFEPPMEGVLPMRHEQRSIVAKLAAILRLSDALDRSYRQKISSCKVSFKNDEMLITVAAKEDLSLERWTFEDKTSLFIEVFGIKPVLIEKNR